MSQRVVDEEVAGVSYLIRPEHIRTSEHFWNAFGNMETEISAHWIVCLSQELGGWKPFSGDQIEEFYRSKGKMDSFTFNRLISDGCIVQGEDGRYRVTHEFICRCYIASPAHVSADRVPAEFRCSFPEADPTDD